MKTIKIISLLGLLLASFFRVPMLLEVKNRDKYRYHYEQIIK